MRCVPGWRRRLIAEEQIKRWRYAARPCYTRTVFCIEAPPLLIYGDAPARAPKAAALSGWRWGMRWAEVQAEMEARTTIVTLTPSHTGVKYRHSLLPKEVPAIFRINLGSNEWDTAADVAKTRAKSCHRVSAAPSSPKPVERAKCDGAQLEVALEASAGAWGGYRSPGVGRDGPALDHWIVEDAPRWVGIDLETHRNNAGLFGYKS